MGQGCKVPTRFVINNVQERVQEQYLGCLDLTLIVSLFWRGLKICLHCTPPSFLFFLLSSLSHTTLFPGMTLCHLLQPNCVQFKTPFSQALWPKVTLLLGEYFRFTITRRCQTSTAPTDHHRWNAMGEFNRCGIRNGVSFYIKNMLLMCAYTVYSPDFIVHASLNAITFI